MTDYIDRFGTIDGVWMDAGATSVGAIEAFEDLGLDVPPITGEDQQDFLRKWKDDGLTAVAPTYPTYQWRTPIIAAREILQRRGSAQGVDAAAAADHRGEPRPVSAAEHAAAALRAVRLREHARLPGGLAVGADAGAGSGRLPLSNNPQQ